MKPKLPIHGSRLLTLAAATILLLSLAACRSGDIARTGREPWAKQTRREVERDWWIQNRHDDSRPSALNPGEHP